MSDNPIITVRLDVDERYPEVLIADDSEYGAGGFYTAEATVDRDTVRRWRRVIAEFEAVQSEMMALYREAGGKG